MRHCRRILKGRSPLPGGRFAPMDLIYRETLPNGLRIVGEKMENYRSVSIGCWVLAGSVFENVGTGGAGGESGISHFIEHMLFKGTETRSAEKIAEEIDAIGGNMNAFTSKECTCFYAKVIDENLAAAVELMADLVCFSRLSEDDIGREKGVVLEEIAMNADSPEDLAHETLCSLYFGSAPLARPVLGTAESVSAFSADMLRSYMARRYSPENVVIAAAGNFEREALREAVEKAFRFDRIAAGKRLPEPEGEYPGMDGRCVSVEKDIEQVHMALAFPGFPSEDPHQYALHVFNNAAGGSMSSRLFQSIRERSGLAYSVYSAPSFFRDGGYFTLYAGTGEKQAEKVLSMMLEEYDALRKHGVAEEELERSKRQLRTSFLLGRENTGAHSSALGRSELFGTRFLSDDEILQRIDGVTREDAEAILPTVCDASRMKAVFVGRVGKLEAGIRDILSL